MKKILILGDTGFIGKKISIYLKNNNYEVHGCSRKNNFDLTNYQSTYDIIKSIKPDVIINCACHVGSVHYGIENPAHIINDNLIMTLNLYKATQQASIKTEIINLLANCSYPGDSEIQTEDNWWKGIPHESALSYGSSRRMTYIISLAYFQQFKISSKNIIIPGIYGPGNHTDTERVHALDGMLIRMIKSKKNNDDKFIIWGTGNPIREWCFIDDLVHLINKTMNLENNIMYPINIGQRQGYSIRETAEMIAKYIDYKGKIIFDTKYQDGANVKILDNSNFKKIFPDFIFTDIRAGIKESAEYYLKII